MPPLPSAPTVLSWQTVVVVVVPLSNAAIEREKEVRERERHSLIAEYRSGEEQQKRERRGTAAVAAANVEDWLRKGRRKRTEER